MTKTKLGQSEFLEKLRPLMEIKGRFFRKKRPILAKKADGGERIATITNDGLETINTARQGDYIVQNTTQAREEYVLSPDKFSKRYAFVQTGVNGYDTYRPTGYIVALELTQQELETLHLPKTFKFEASWQAEMIAKTGDYLAAPIDFSEVYRIARKEFFETYEPAEDTDMNAKR